MTAILLPLDALPTGFSMNPPDPNPPANQYFCDIEPPFEEQMRVRRDFQKGGGISAEVASVTIRQYESAEEASAVFKVLEQTISTCTTDILNGEELTYSQLNVASVGEQSIGVRIEGPVFLLQGFALVGPAIISGGAGGLLNADAALQADVLAKQVEQYMAQAQG